MFCLPEIGQGRFHLLLEEFDILLDVFVVEFPLFEEFQLLHHLALNHGNTVFFHHLGLNGLLNQILSEIGT